MSVKITIELSEADAAAINRVVAFYQTLQAGMTRMSGMKEPIMEGSDRLGNALARICEQWEVDIKSGTES